MNCSFVITQDAWAQLSPPCTLQIRNTSLLLVLLPITVFLLLCVPPHFTWLIFVLPSRFSSDIISHWRKRSPDSPVGFRRPTLNAYITLLCVCTLALTFFYIKMFVCFCYNIKLFESRLYSYTQFFIF